MTPSVSLAWHRERARGRRRLLALAVTALLLLVTFLLDILTGPAMLPLREVIAALLPPMAPAEGMVQTIVWNIRLPMALTAVVVGASLAVAGVEMQTILDNPLASPYTLGLSAASGFGAALAILSGASLFGRPEWAVPLFAFLGAVAGCGAIYAVGRLRGLSSGIMVLAGIAILFLFQSLLSLLQYLASPETLQEIVFWLFGSLLKANWRTVAISSAVLLAVVPLLAREVWRLTALRLGEERARSLGIDVERLRLRVFLSVSLLTAAAVAFVGTIGFVGLVAPHVARMLVGEDQRFLLPLAALCGAVMLSAASILSKLISPGAVVPIGIVTAVAGLPFFFALILRRGGGGR